MRIVIDTNMIFSLLLGKNVQMRETFFDPAHLFFAPNYILGEIFEKKEKIMKCSALSEPEIYELFHRILGKIQFIAEDFVALVQRSRAFGLCKDVDENNTPFFALSLQLNTVFWTGDKRLKEHLKKQGFHLFFEQR